MIYFDNSATTLKKPPEVAEAVKYAIEHLGNAGRSFYSAALDASREIYKTRAAIASLIGHSDPLQVAFTSSSTESLNLVISALIHPGDHVLTTVLEHNSVLRPLYLSGCELSVIGCDDGGNLLLDTIEELIKPNTKYLVCTHGSNVLGGIVDLMALRSICRAHGIIMVVDVSQTFGAVDVGLDMADIFCFTGHKGLFGPQGTGGIITNGNFAFKHVKTGGSGVKSFEALQPAEMPDIFEAGTHNSHGLYGLQKGVQFIAETGIEHIYAKEAQLLEAFYGGIKGISNVTIYGDMTPPHLPVIALNIGTLPSTEVAQMLWECYGIATRAGSHCAPLLHERFGTRDRGMVRFSFSYFNTPEEIEVGINAVREIAAEAGEVV